MRAGVEHREMVEAIGYRVVAYRTLGFRIAAVAASLAGTIHAVWIMDTGPVSTLADAIVTDILLTVAVGGMGTMRGAVIGAVLLVLAHYHLRDFMGLAADATAGLPLPPHLLAADRWLFWLGILFILLVCYSPFGIAGTVFARESRP